MPTIKDLREAKNWSQSDLSQIAKVGTTTISLMERGKPVGRNSFEAVCLALVVNPQVVTGVQVTPSFRPRKHITE